jgi:hypothetical protein
MQRYLVMFLRMLYNSIYELHHSHIEVYLMYADQAEPNCDELNLARDSLSGTENVISACFVVNLSVVVIAEDCAGLGLAFFQSRNRIPTKDVITSGAPGIKEY